MENKTWAPNNSIINRLQVTQRTMERRILNINLQDRITNTKIRKTTKVKDVIKKICARKLNWAGHIGRMAYNKWTWRILKWRPWENKRSRGRPQTRWSVDIKRLAGHDWMEKPVTEKNGKN